jgi:trehalose 6-phosphate synthase
VREFNVFRWAGRMLMDAAAIRRRGRVLDRSGTMPGSGEGRKDVRVGSGSLA